MSADKIKALEHRFFESWNKGKAALLAAIDETCATNIVYHGALGGDIIGLKDFKQYMSVTFDAFPDSRIVLDDIIVEGDKAVVRYTATGTHTGTLQGIPPTNKKITLWAIEIDRIAEGKFVEAWTKTDTLGLMQQLGVVPMPKK